MFMTFFNENLISPRMLIENKSSIVRNLARFSILQENLNEDEKLELIQDAKKVADAIKTKTDEIIKDEVKNAKKKKGVEDSLKGNDEEGGEDDKKEGDDPAEDDMDAGADDADADADDSGGDDDDSDDAIGADDSDDDDSDDDSDDDDKKDKDDSDDDTNVSVNISVDNDNDDDDKKKKKKKGLEESASLGIHRTVRDNRKGTFMRFLRESAKEYADVRGTLQMEGVLGDASIKYTILECLNTMNLVTDKNKQALIDVLNGRK